MSDEVWVSIGGQRLALTSASVRAGLVGHVPGPLRRYSVDVDGDVWPAKQVIALATSTEPSRFQSSAARRWLQALGFTISTVDGHPPTDATPAVPPAPSVDLLDAAEVIAHLQDGLTAQSLDELIAGGGAGLRTPGLYSWWVDDAGAGDLTAGLGHSVESGLVYAGLAGATRTSGVRSTNTLWGRIATMHLGKRHDFSTLRRSLGSILATARSENVIDEVGLTQWMHDHLRIVTLPYPDAHTLGELETLVLAELDPPLNLAKVPRTELRQRLAALRKRYTPEKRKNA